MTTYYPTFQTPPVRVVFEKIHPDAIAPTRATVGSAGWDLYACGKTVQMPLGADGQVCKVRTGIRVKIPEGYEGQIRPRSSVAKEQKFIANAPGTIDSDYRGELCILMYSPRSGFAIFPGDRIAQLIIAPVPRVEFVEGIVANDTERGEGGFGSTGK